MSKAVNRKIYFPQTHTATASCEKPLNVGIKQNRLFPTIKIKSMFEATTVHAKYIFLDVVDFTRNRSVEAQADIVYALNKVVESSVTEVALPKENLIFIPTGDGICVVLLNIESPYDAHLLTALSIVKGIDEHNNKTGSDMRKFKVRIGINSNTDNLITDINGSQNIAGAGISMASRIMGMADGNQILVGEPVFDTLRYREQYMSSFRPFSATVKHSVQIPIYQFIEDGHCGLDTNVPHAFQVKRTEIVLEKKIAYYFAHAIRHKNLILERLGKFEAPSGIILLWFLSMSAERTSEITEIYKVYQAEEAFIEERFNYYNSLDRDMKQLLADLIIQEHLKKYEENFEHTGTAEYLFINSKGKKKLALEWRNIWDEFELYRYG